ncbi:MAG: hypothetical protein HC869_25420 [Rhodospirillales bacterium]|nr:hypothetical protein [Rhodospirillales bacterium]
MALPGRDRQDRAAAVDDVMLDLLLASLSISFWSFWIFAVAAVILTGALIFGSPPFGRWFDILLALSNISFWIVVITAFIIVGLSL